MKAPLLQPQASASVVILLGPAAEPTPPRPCRRTRAVLVCATAFLLTTAVVYYTGGDDDVVAPVGRHARDGPNGPQPSRAGLPFSDRTLRLDKPELNFLVVGDWGRQGTYQDRQVVRCGAPL